MKKDFLQKSVIDASEVILDGDLQTRVGRRKRVSTASPPAPVPSEKPNRWVDRPRMPATEGCGVMSPIKRVSAGRASKRVPGRQFETSRREDAEGVRGGDADGAEHVAARGAHRGADELHVAIVEEI